jgi:hypothetical protein
LVIHRADGKASGSGARELTIGLAALVLLEHCPSLDWIVSQFCSRDEGWPQR